jgi:RNA polymerase sigma-70 factor (ECF subfamily)
LLIIGVMSTEPGETGRGTGDTESRQWVERLRSTGSRHEEAVGRLRGLLVRAAFDELSRRRGQLGSLADREYDDLAQQATDGALTSVMRELDEFRGPSRFTSWAFRFVISEVARVVARHAWRQRPPSRDQLEWDELPDWLAPRHDEHVEQREQLNVLSAAIGELSDRQREAFVAIALNDVPIDVLALQLGSNRDATYRSLFDARRTLRSRLAAAGHAVLEDDGTA